MIKKIVVTLLAFAISATPQQVGQNTAGAGTPTFQSSTQLVIETVTVKDKDGKSVEGLTAKDFSITEDGVAQTIRFFEFQKFEEAVPAPVLPPSVRPEPLARFARTQIAPEAAGDVRYRD